MKVRSLLISDLTELEKIHNKSFSDDFIFPDFNKFIGTFCILDDDNRIILAGGCKPLIEAVLVTDQTKSIRERRDALISAMTLSTKFCEVVEQNQLHAFVQDSSFASHLRKFGFKDIKGEGLVLNF